MYGNWNGASKVTVLLDIDICVIFPKSYKEREATV